MAADGICPDHSEDVNEPVVSVPSSLVEPAQPVISHVLYRLLYEMRRKFLESESIQRIKMDDDLDEPFEKFESAEVGMGDGFNEMVELLTHMAMSSSLGVLKISLVAS